MVQLHIKKGDQSQFLFDASVEDSVGTVLKSVMIIYNGRLKIERICYELAELSKHGVSLPPNMVGLTEEQITELKLVDEWGDRCSPMGGHVLEKDPLSRRNGKSPLSSYKDILNRSIDEAKALVSKKQVDANVVMTPRIIQESLDILKGAMLIVYPMGLPPYDPIQMEFSNKEELEGTQASKEVIEESMAQLWFCGKEMLREKNLKDYLGRNEKCKVVVKLHKRGQGAPAREPLMTEEQQKKMMALAYKRQEELKKLEEADDDSYLNSAWADPGTLKRTSHGIKNIHWKPKF